MTSLYNYNNIILERRDFMKKNLIEYYAVIIMILFVVYNLILENLKINGLIYQIFMVLLIVVNLIILIIFRKKIEYKNLVIVVYFFIWGYSKNILQCFFDFSNIIVLCLIGFTESKLTKFITLSIVIFVCMFFHLILFIFLLSFGTSLNEERGMNDIYENTHYYCDNNYEVYSFSGGVFDSFHYSVGKHFDILIINDIINISYRERKVKTKEEYELYLKTHNCVLAGDINGIKEYF